MKNVHPDVELVLAGGQHALKGAARVRAWMEPEAFESQGSNPWMFASSEDKVLVRQRAHIKGAGSGIEADFVNWQVWTYGEAGLATRLEIFLPHQEAEALEAVGLSEQDASEAS